MIAIDKSTAHTYVVIIALRLSSTTYIVGSKNKIIIFFPQERITF